MLPAIEQSAMDSLDDSALIWVCIEPVIRQIRGKSISKKKEVSSRLTPGQQALLMFQVFYGHAGDGIAGFYNSTSYLLSDKGFWNELIKGMEYFGCHSMAELIYEMKEQYAEQIDIAADHDSALERLLPMEVEMVGSYIRCHPAEFIRIIRDPD